MADYSPHGPEGNQWREHSNFDDSPCRPSFGTSRSPAASQPEVSLTIEPMLLLLRIAMSLHCLSCDDIAHRSTVLNERKATRAYLASVSDTMDWMDRCVDHRWSEALPMRWESCIGHRYDSNTHTSIAIYHETKPTATRNHFSGQHQHLH